MINRLVFVTLVIASVYVSGLIAGEWIMFAGRFDSLIGPPFIVSLVAAFFIPLIVMVLTAQWVCFNKKDSQNA